MDDPYTGGGSGAPGPNFGRFGAGNGGLFPTPDLDWRSGTLFALSAAVLAAIFVIGGDNDGGVSVVGRGFLIVEGTDVGMCIDPAPTFDACPDMLRSAQDIDAVDLEAVEPLVLTDEAAGTLYTTEEVVVTVLEETDEFTEVVTRTAIARLVGQD